MLHSQNNYSIYIISIAVGELETHVYFVLVTFELCLHIVHGMWLTTYNICTCNMTKSALSWLGSQYFSPAHI